MTLALTALAWILVAFVGCFGVLTLAAAARAVYTAWKPKAKPDPWDADIVADLRKKLEGR